MQGNEINYDYIEKNLLKVKRKVERICANCGRNASEIYIIAVSKTFPVEAVISALDFNQLDFGENKVQEMESKHLRLEDRIIHWHLIGHLQSNKVKQVVPFVFMIHSIDSFKLAHKLNSEAAKINKVIKCLVQINTTGEEQKSGCDIKHTLKLVKEISVLENIKVKGLMTIARIMNDEKNEDERNTVRKNMRDLKEQFEEIKSLSIQNVDMKYLSMGMSSDYDIAVEEGSNMLRIGSAIFGERTYNNA